MSEVFLKVVNMSISAGWLVLAVLALRLILKKAPKWVNVLLWGIVAIRLICPFSIESALSLIPSAETIPLHIGMDTTPAIQSGVEMINSSINPIISQSNTPMDGASINPLQITIAIYANVWVLGAIAMLIYTAISYISLRRKLRTAVILRDNIFQCETVSSPFVLGILKPRIYLPYAMDGKNLIHVVAHEKAHIRRKDHWWKPLGFLLLTVYWFNPLMWVAYILLCRDIELACDEKVIAELENDQRADYTQALVTCAVNRRMIAACPLAFGEVGVKDRVNSIMNYRKPTLWVIVTAIAACAVVAVCFLTDPFESNTVLLSGEYQIAGMLYSHAPSYEENFVPSDSYSVSSELELYEKNVADEWVCLGTMEKYLLTNQELYSYNLEGWHRRYPVGKITDAYILRVENDFFYLVFQTKNGNTYLAYGWEDVAERGQEGSDDTGLRRLYQLKGAASPDESLREKICNELELSADCTLHYIGAYTEDPNALLWFSIEGNYPHQYIAVECEWLSSGKYKFVDIFTPMTYSTDIVHVIWNAEDIFLVNNRDCASIVYKDQNGEIILQTNLTEHDFPYIFPHSPPTNPGITTFLDSQGKEIR